MEYLMYTLFYIPNLTDLNLYSIIYSSEIDNNITYVGATYLANGLKKVPLLTKFCVGSILIFF